MKRIRSVIQGVCLLAFTVSLLPGLAGCGSSEVTGETVKRDEAKVKAEQQQTAEAYKEFQKTHKGKRK
jgi:hypothetical protein